MKTLFHGTTKDNYLNIVANGFNPTNESWNCSSDTDIYFYDLDKAEQDETEYKKDECIRYAFESAQTAASIQGFKGTDLVVLEVEIDNEYAEDDYSCENMADRATQVGIDYLQKYGKVTNVYICNEYNPFLRFFYISFILDNQYANTWRFNELETAALQAISECEGMNIEELLEFNWESTGVEIDLSAEKQLVNV